MKLRVGGVGGGTVSDDAPSPLKKSESKST